MALQEKLQSIASVLDACHGRPKFEELCKRQGERAMKMIEEASSEDWGKVLDIIKKSGWPAELEDRLLDTVCEKMANDTPQPPPAKVSRTSTQNYEMWHRFVPQAVWDSIKGGETDPLFDHLAKLGLRNPSEPTSAAIALGSLLQSDGNDKVMNMPPETRFQFLKTTKHAFKHRSKIWPKLDFYVSVLPESVQDFARIWPKQCSEVFAGGRPADAPFQDVQLKALLACTPFRATRSTAKQLPMMMPSCPNQQPDMMRMLMAMASTLQQQVSPQEPSITFLPRSKTAMLLDSKSPLVDVAASQPEPPHKAELQFTDFDNHIAPETAVPSSSVDDIAKAICTELDSKGKAKAKAKSVCMKRPAAAADVILPSKMEISTVIPKADQKNVKPTVSVEKTRSQVLARTGLKGPNMNKTFKYSDGKVEEAKAHAHRWLKAVMEKMGSSTEVRFLDHVQSIVLFSGYSGTHFTVWCVACGGGQA
jgi:hypothetical protein